MEKRSAKPKQSAKLKQSEQERLEKLTEYERDYWARGVLVGGMDEAGRGPLAGPVVSACVVMPPEPLIHYVNDSKQLTEKRRESLYEEILHHALCVGVGHAEQQEIDELNILRATRLSFKRAYQAMASPPQCVLVDALKSLDIPATQTPIIHGDALSYSIAAASIVAKVQRDHIMAELDAIYPQYGFIRNKGYGTPEHIRALREYGPCPVHRQSFIRNFVDTEQSLPANEKRTKGRFGEETALRYLMSLGMEHIASNYRAQRCEVDLIMQDGEELVFVEVKAREGNAFGSGREAVDKGKQKNILKAAQSYLMTKDAFDAKVRFDVVEIELHNGTVEHFKAAFTA